MPHIFKKKRKGQDYPLISGLGHSDRTIKDKSQIVGKRALVLAALGVVYGDIGTSPLYALRECFNPSHGISPTQLNVFGILSLIFWSLTLVVSIKYLIFILSADNKGEGGVTALMALILPYVQNEVEKRNRNWIMLLGIFGTALLYGDGIITPAISVLSAIEGLSIAAPTLMPAVVPITVVILFSFFSMQYRGTSMVGAIFGPIMLIWFLTLIGIALPWVIKRPDIFQALNPYFAVQFCVRNGTAAFFTLSAVVLCITGAEALYADMGHFGKSPIRIGWFSIVFPSLLINYFGQGALILEVGEKALVNPFYGLVTGWMLYPLVILATFAAIIASQALISGAYSLTLEAIQLGYFPRTQIIHTSKESQGQVYIAQVNNFLMIGSIGLVILFEHSSELAGAYGIAVTGTMVITSILFYEVAQLKWRWSPFLLFGLVGSFLFLDLGFFLANTKKFMEGGWIPVVIALVLSVIMTTWRRGREVLSKTLATSSIPLDRFFGRIRKTLRVPGAAIFMTVTENIAPPVLLHHLKHNQILHESVIFLTIRTLNFPQIDPKDRIKVTELEAGFFKILANFGYMERPDISEVLIYCLAKGLPLDVNEISFYLGRESLLATGSSGMFYWRKKLFIYLSRNARPMSDYFGLPPSQVIEIGSQVSI